MYLKYHHRAIPMTPNIPEAPVEAHLMTRHFQVSGLRVRREAQACSWPRSPETDSTWRSNCLWEVAYCDIFFSPVFVDDVHRCARTAAATCRVQ